MQQERVGDTQALFRLCRSRLEEQAHPLYLLLNAHHPKVPVGPENWRGEFWRHISGCVCLSCLPYDRWRQQCSHRAWVFIATTVLEPEEGYVLLLLTQDVRVHKLEGADCPCCGCFRGNYPTRRICSSAPLCSQCACKARRGGVGGRRRSSSRTHSQSSLVHPCIPHRYQHV